MPVSINILPRETVQDRFSLIRSVGEECITETDLMNLIEKKPVVRCYDGFEPSGRMHIAQGILRAINVNKCTAGGCEFVFWVADWFALMNDKMGGELDRIRLVGQYLVEVWKSAGMNMEKIVFLWSSDVITKNHAEYWKRVCDIARRNTLARIKKCCTIMGKAEGTLTGAQVMYPLMQCSDIFELKADICQLGQDQRKVNMLCREYCDQIGKKLKPVVLSHHMLAGLLPGQAKMSKSNPASAIFVEDTAEDVEKKIMDAYCPKVKQAEQIVTEDGLASADTNINPVLDYCNALVFSIPNTKMVVGDREFDNYNDLETAFLTDEISEISLKRGLIDVINAFLDPVRRHFSENVEARKLFETIKSYKKESFIVKAPERTLEKETLVLWLPPVVHLPLHIADAIVHEVKQFFETRGKDADVVLVLPSLSAFARDALSGDEGDIKTAMEYNALFLKFYGLDSRVRVVAQTDLIALDPSGYWIAAMNFGRKYKLADIETAVGGEAHNSGCIIAQLMRYADAFTLGATETITIPEYDFGQNDLVNDFLGGICPSRRLKIALPFALGDPSAPTEQVFNPDNYLFVDENDMTLRRKIKKAFAAEKNSNNAVVSIALHFLHNGREIQVQRPESNGGDIIFSTENELLKAYNDGRLHPADLKSTVTECLLEFTQKAREEIKNTLIKSLAKSIAKIEKKMKK